MKNFKLLLSIAMIVVFTLSCSQKVTEPTPPDLLTVSIRPIQVSRTVPATVYFDDIHSGGLDPLHWLWNFGDKGTATLEKPSHTYTDTGTFWVTLILSSSDGQKALDSVPIIVGGPNMLIASAFAVPPQGQVPYTTTFIGSAVGGTGPYSFSWTALGESTILGNDANFPFTLSEAGIYTFVFTVTSGDKQISKDTVSALGMLEPVKNMPPVLSMNLYETNAIVNQTVVYASNTGSRDPDGRIVSTFWDFGDGFTSSADSVSHVYHTAGLFRITCIITDDSAAATTDDRYLQVDSVDIHKNQPPIAALTATPTTWYVDSAFTFSSFGSNDPDGRIVSTFWDFGDGSTFNGLSSHVTHAYAQAGLYKVTLTVTDDSSSESSASAYVQVDTVPRPSNKPPVLVMTASPINGIVNQTVVYCSAAGSSDSDGVVTDYVWSFGDGSFSTGMNTSHVYKSTGLFMITCTIADNKGAHVSDQRYVLIDTTATPQQPDTCFQDLSMCLTASSSCMRVSGKLKNPAGQFYIAVKIELCKPKPDLISGISFPYLGKIQGETIIDPNPSKTGTYQAIIVLGSQFFMNANTDFDFSFQAGPTGSSVKLLGVYGCTDRANLLNLKP